MPPPPDPSPPGPDRTSPPATSSAPLPTNSPTPTSYHQSNAQTVGSHQQQIAYQQYLAVHQLGGGPLTPTSGAGADRCSPQERGDSLDKLNQPLGLSSPLNKTGLSSPPLNKSPLFHQTDKISPQERLDTSGPHEDLGTTAPQSTTPVGGQVQSQTQSLEAARKRRRKREDPQSCFGITSQIELSDDEFCNDDDENAVKDYTERRDNTSTQNFADDTNSSTISNNRLGQISTEERSGFVNQYGQSKYQSAMIESRCDNSSLQPGDVEQFEGRIVYNPDGSAYIIEDSDLSEDGSLANFRDGCIIDGRGLQAPPIIPKVDSAHYLPPAISNPPVMHSFKVLSAQDIGQDHDLQKSVPTKPILMCFVCKLSFGHAKAFASHASQDHSLDLSEDELKLLARESASAIVQRAGDTSQKLLVSFLEPLEPIVQQPVVNVAPQIQLSVKSQQQLLQQSYMRKSPSISPPASSNILSHLQQNLQQNMQIGTTIGACPEHISTGRPAGLDCQRCEIMLNRLGVSNNQHGQQQQTPPHSRNSCKTLKCPKCNWHYKYQETLEIHMKEKHPDGESACAFCLAGQPHPRLARGETYTCGYKPYRCEVCNYSTTTKGNLSIHMQSDKHLNNMQELQSSGQSTIINENHRGTSPKINQQPSLIAQNQPQINVSNKPKPTFRCDVCSYETGVARNLRIHMTSEKHTHNMAVLQQNVKHLQALSALHMQQQQQQLQNVVDQQQIPTAEAALADMAYSQALMIQLMTGGSIPNVQQNTQNLAPNELPPHLDLGLNPEAMEPPPEPADPEPNFLYSCLVCSCFHTDNLEALGLHLAQDRTRSREQDVLSLINGHYVCRLCSYKTNLKANFQLHCKTDKHLQRLQHVNHVKEGGLRNEWKLKYPSAGSVQLRCHACDYYTNSAHKLQMHSAGARHDSARTLFRYLTEAGNQAVQAEKNSDYGQMNAKNEQKVYLCRLCGHRAQNKLQLLQHVRSMMHLRMEHQHQLMRRAAAANDGTDGQSDLQDLFHVVIEKQEPIDIKPDLAKESPDQSFNMDIQQSSTTTTASSATSQQISHQQTASTALQINQQSENPNQQQSPVSSTITQNQQQCPFCNFSCESDLKLQNHLQNNHQTEAPPKSPDAPPLLCPLCQDGFKERTTLEKHVMQIHSVNAEGLQRLLMLVDQSHWLNRSSSSSSTPGGDQNETAPSNNDEEKCPQCSTVFRTNDELCLHRLESGHLNSGNQCPKTGCGQNFTHLNGLISHFRDTHGVNQTPTGALVSERHVYKYRCNQCSLAFKTLDKLTAHSHYHAMRDATKCSKCGRGFRSAGALQRHLETSHCDEENQNQIEDLTGDLTPETIEGIQDSDDPQKLLEDYLNSPALAEEGYNDPNRKHKCHRCRSAFTSQLHLSNHNKSLQHRRGEKLAYPLEKFLDPNRPFKCDVCKESFTQKNILLVHYNSVSHLHKLKRAALQDNNNIPTLNNTQQSPQQQLDQSVPSPTNSQNQQQMDDEKKPFRCDICRVAYAQGSTLDIHMRSVLHQTRACRLQNPDLQTASPTTPPIVSSPETLTPSSPNALMLQQHHQQQDKSNKQQNPSQQMYKTLLESFGFDLVMQYNEAKNASPPRQETPKELLMNEGPYTCQHCHKSFSSIFVLKTHCEEVHRDKVPLEFLEQFAEHFKTEYEKKIGDDCSVSTDQQQDQDNADAASVNQQQLSNQQQHQQQQQQQQQQQNMQQMQLMNEMQAALNVMQFHPMMAQMMSMGLPLGLNMNALAAMNLQPPLVPLMMPPPPYGAGGGGGDPLMGAGAGAGGQMGHSPQQGVVDGSMLAKQHAAAVMMQQQQANAAANQKRARTRITDEQLKILRAHFDINNSPSEEAILEMATRSSLPPKVIKHWFRNTLFKERQRNKDSPYNFNNPPSTTLNLEEYEKTGEAKVTQLNSSSSSQEDIAQPPTKRVKSNTPENIEHPHQQNIKPEPMDHQDITPSSVAEDFVTSKYQYDQKPQSPAQSLSGSENMLSRPQSPISQQHHLTLSSLVQSQLDSIPTCTIPAMLPPPRMANQNQFASPTGNPSLNLTTDMSGNSSNGSSSSGSSGKRANRTRFTDYQIKVLQEFFENNAYPKDDDLEYLSKLLGLSPRVIVVWFQNARQKARKVYENQPAQETTPPPNSGADDPNRFQRTPGLNYQCKKCQLVFQRYYELIRHQKTHCFKEEDARRSAQAQAAAAQVAASLSSEDSNSSTVENQQQQHGNALNLQQPPQQQLLQQQQQAVTPIPQQQQPIIPQAAQMLAESPVANQTPSNTIASSGDMSPQPSSNFQCDKCQLVFSRFELWREHQLVHLMNPGLFPPNYPPDSPFGILQQLGGQPDQKMMKIDDYDMDTQDSQNHSPRDKRLRTTILPEQLDYLYQKYQQESNPSRKMLETIARDVGLKKRVVQVWFQNTRARERKGQFRAHAQVINKRCPFCPALFKVKSALETHLTAKHAEQCSRSEINIDALPDEELSTESENCSSKTMPPPNLYGPLQDVEALLKRCYGEESMRRYMESTGDNSGETQPSMMLREGEIPLDLSKPLTKTEGGCDSLSDLSEISLSCDFYDEEGGPISPASSTQSSRGGQQNLPNSTKRFRTQMSALQVRMLKSLFNDYATPSMTECEFIGKEVGLPKRVVQVWFQNARAKDKKARQSAAGGELQNQPKTPEECRICDVEYSPKLCLQEHLFSVGHIQQLKLFLEQQDQLINNGVGMQQQPQHEQQFQMPPPPQQLVDAQQNTANANALLLQMAAAATKSFGAAAAAGSAQNAEQEQLLQQLYGLAALQQQQQQNQQQNAFLPPMLGANDYRF